MIRIVYGVLLCLTYTVLFPDTVISQTWSDDGKDKDVDIRSMLMTVRKQNRRLELQNNRLQKIWLGMQQMCSALGEEACACEDRDKNVGKEGDRKKDSEHIQIIFVETSGYGTEDGNLTVRVGYTAPRVHTHEWYYMYAEIYGFTTRTSGRNVTGSYGPNYTFEVTIESPETLAYFLFCVNTEHKYLQITFNLTNINTQETQYLREPISVYLNVKPVFEAPKDTDLKINITFNATQEVLRRSIDDLQISFEGVNSTISPPTIFNIDNCHYEMFPTAQIQTVTATIPHSKVQFGGLLMPLVTYTALSTGLIERFLYGDVVRILRHGSKTVVAENTVGVHRVAKQIIIGEMSQSLYCSAMGNPHPQVSIMKMSKGGKTKVLESETLYATNEVQVSSHTFKHDPKNNNIEGRYVCRATSGNRTIDQETELLYLNPAVFDDSKTKVVKNTTESIVISCKASGTPIPEVQMYLYSEFENGILLTCNPNELYKVKRKNTKKSSRVILTLFPYDDIMIPLSTFQNVLCVAEQGDDAVRNTRIIELFPGVNETVDRWDLGVESRLHGNCN